MKVQTAMCKDKNNSKSRAATYVKFNMYVMISVDYNLCIKYSIVSRVFYLLFYFFQSSGKYHGECLTILYAYLNGSH